MDQQATGSAARIAIVCAALVTATAAAPAGQAEDWTKSYSISTRAQVHVDTNDGAVSVLTVDTKQVEIHVQYSGYQLDKDLHIDSRQEGDSVQIMARVSSHWGWYW